MQVTRTISVLEIIWTVLCLPGLFFASRLFLRSGSDLLALKIKRINSIREYAAITTMILYGFLALVQFVFVLLGFFLMFVPNSRYSAAQLVVATGFIIVSFTSDIALLTLEARRQELLRKIAEIEGFDDK